MFNFLVYLVKAVLARRFIKTEAQLNFIEQETASDLARQLALPEGSIVVKARPVLQVELKVPVSGSQIAQLERILGRVKGIPPVNSRPMSGLN